MSRIKLLILAYDYPPSKRVAGLRPASWQHYLDKSKFDVRVVAGPWAKSDGIVTYSGPPNGEGGIDSKVSNLRLAMSQIRLLMGFLYSRFDTTFPVLVAANRMLPEWTPVAVISTGEPFILFKYARKISKQSGAIWIADYRDPWSNEKSIRQKSRLMTFLNDLFFSRIEKRLLKSADIITTTSQPYKDLISEATGRSDIQILPNGFDLPSDFKFKELRRDKLVFGYFGRLYIHRDFRIFLQGVKQYIDSTGDKKVEIRFYGLADFPDQREWIESFSPDLSPHFVFLKLRPYSELMISAQDCHLFLLFSDGFSNFAPTKFYDYIGSNRPIWLSPSDGGYLSETIRRENLGLVMENSDEVEKSIAIARAKLNSKSLEYFSIASSGEHSRKASTKKLEELILNYFENKKYRN